MGGDPMTREHPGQLLKALRKELRATQVEMAQHLGCSQGFISKVEHGKQEPTLEVFCRAARLTRCLSRAPWERKFQDFFFGE
jgi:transcriptional regulator with XRE-family HTH domain